MSAQEPGLRLTGVDGEQVALGEGHPVADFTMCLDVAIEDSAGYTEAFANLEPREVRRLRDYLTKWLDVAEQDELRKQVRG